MAQRPAEIINSRLFFFFFRDREQRCVLAAELPETTLEVEGIT